MTPEEFKQRMDRITETKSGHCPVAAVTRMLQGKWKLQILYELCRRAPLRFGELRRALDGVTNLMLTSALRELEADGLVRREQFNEIPPHVEYSLTDRGEDLLPVFYEMAQWGLKYIP